VAGAVLLCGLRSVRRDAANSRGESGFAGGREEREQDLASRVYTPWATEEANMPVLLLWAVPAVVVIGGVGYYLVRAVH
jgi:hypothetical protein